MKIDGNTIWVNRQGRGALTVVFDAGFGNDSTVWTEFSKLEARVRSAGFQTFVYDRAGMGKSTINEQQPYSLENDSQILRTTFDRCELKGPLLLVGHSYGGAIALMTVRDDGRVKGLVLLDAAVPGVWDEGEFQRNMDFMRPQLPVIEKEAPMLAKVVVPYVNSLESIYASLGRLKIPPGMPVADIVAERGVDNPRSIQIWRNAHLAFVAEDQFHRQYILAPGAPHKLMAHSEDLALASILQIAGQIR